MKVKHVNVSVSLRRFSDDLKALDVEYLDGHETRLHRRLARVGQVLKAKARAGDNVESLALQAARLSDHITSSDPGLFTTFEPAVEVLEAWLRDRG